ncbi:unnamed protein product [Anisakis simplex]|uniref:DUF148 domain-containing protein n=1 Tax=Anisakis simplex TaxID=6269 RepID=A0A0M3K6I7_ANISI|nr:unnamed protein product [Anisakis simplex]
MCTEGQSVKSPQRTHLKARRQIGEANVAGSILKQKLLQFVEDASRMCTIKLIILVCCCFALALADRDQLFRLLPVPKFAEGASPKAIKELRAILRDMTQSKRNLNERVAEWADQQGPKFRKAYDEAMKDMKEHAKEVLKKLPTLDVSDEIKDVVKKILELRLDDSISIHEEMLQGIKLVRPLSFRDIMTVREILSPFATP